MSNTVFPFRFLDKDAGGDYAGTLVAVDEIEAAQGGRTAVIARASKTQFAAAGTLILPDKAGNKASDFWVFWDARQGRVDTFLFAAPEAYLSWADAEAVGTHAGGVVAYTLDMRHIDAATLRVFVAGVEQTLTTDYSFSGNDVAPTITTTGSFDNGAITAEYRYRMPVRFAMDRPRPRLLRLGLPSWADQEAVAISVELIEDRPGGRFA